MLFASRLIALIWFLGFANYVASSCLPPQELEALSVVARKLGKMDWNFDGVVDPCTNELPWWDNSVIDGKGVNCSFIPIGNDTNTTTCHVTQIILKTENLNGSLPKELVGLPYLQDINLERNYLNGNLPPEWGSMEFLRKITVLGNRLTGPIPPEYGNITALEELVLEANHFTGNIPGEFGDLPLIKRLQLTSNNFTGELSPNLAKMTTLEVFRISDNNFTGSIPNYIQNWIYIKRMEIQASGLSGPIPSNLTFLTKLTDLRISDLNGNQSDFPILSTSTKWEQVILRRCNIVGELPNFIEHLMVDDSLDLSFNNLTGPVPPALGVQKGDIYLTGNSFTGEVPELMKDKRNIDLSYNNFTPVSPEPRCATKSPNLFANSNGNTNGAFYCVNPQCKSNDFYSFYINCGSRERVGKYEADNSAENFYRGTNWGFSSTGKFWDYNKISGYGKSLIASSNLSISGPPESKLYSTARLSPLSLTYYGFCLRNGKYRVDIHFAEIMFTNDTTYRSLGRRIFDIYIQGKLVEKDFNIENAAGGVNTPKTMSYHAFIGDHTLEIRFYWAGKGTAALPMRSVYGPLISAISVVHATYKPGSGISTGAKVGIAMAAIFALVLFVGILRLKGCLGGKHSMYHDLKGLDFRTGSFTLRQIRAATNNFDPANKIGEGGFGPVYKGVLLDKTIIAVKQLSSKSNQGNREFINEIGMISALQHPHLVKLYGCCIEGNQLLLVYEYLENNSLARALFGPAQHQLHLDWPMRKKICVGIARGLAYLHEESRLKIVHRDIKATNVLLDKNLVPKISDFGLAKLDEDDSHISTRIAGTFGYMAPEYAMRGYLTDKADVYSFGVVVLEIVSGRSNSSVRRKEDNFYLLDWAISLKEKGNLLELVDRRLELSLNKEEITRAINAALICTNVVAAERPSMSAVVSILEGKDGDANLVSELSSSVGKIKLDEVEMGAAVGEGVFMDAPWIGSSSPAVDLYPIAPDTNYWEKRGS